MDGQKLSAIGISGWNAKTEQVVEHWYGENGLYITVRYPLPGMQDDAWRGTFTAVYASGKEESDRCVLKKQDQDRWVFTVSWEESGTKHVRRNVTRRK